MRTFTPLDGFLHEMRTTGEHDSEGHFTIALDKSAWKLSKYRLARPGEYALHLLAAAVEGGAKKFQLKRTGGLTTIEFDGPSFSGEELLSLRNLHSKASDVRIDRLKVAISAASGLGTVRLISPEDGGSLCNELVVAGNEVIHRQVASDGSDSTRFIVESELANEDLQNFSQRSRFAPLDVRVTTYGFSASRTTSAKGVAYFQYQNEGPFQYRSLVNVGFLNVNLSKPLSVPGSYFLKIVPEATKRRSGVISLIQSGIVIEETEGLLNYPFLTGAVSLPTLPLDLSQRAFARTPAFDKVLAELDEFGKEAMELFLSGNHRMDLEEQKLLGRGLSEFHSNILPPGPVSDFVQSSRKLWALEFLKPTRIKGELDTIVRTAQQTNDWSEQAAMKVALQSEIKKAWGKQIWWSAKQWSEALRYLSKASGELKPGVDGGYHGLRYLCEGQLNPEFLYDYLQNKEVPTQARYRALLLLAETLSPNALVNHLKTLRVPEVWQFPILLLANKPLMFKKNYQAKIWEVARRLSRGGPFKGIVGLLEDGLKFFNVTDQTKELWTQVLLTATRGKLEWWEQVKLRRAATAHLLDFDFTGRRGFKKFVQGRRSPEPPTESLNWFMQAPEEPEWVFPLLTYQLFLLSEDRFDVGARVLCQRLLVESFRNSRWPGDFEEPLPARLFGL